MTWLNSSINLQIQLDFRNCIYADEIGRRVIVPNRPSPVNNLLEDTHSWFCIKGGWFHFPKSLKVLSSSITLISSESSIIYLLLCRFRNHSSYQIFLSLAHWRMRLIHTGKRHQQNQGLGSTAMTFLRTENEHSLFRVRMNYFVRMYTVMLVSTSFEQLAILYDFLYWGFTSELIFLSLG